MQLLKSQFNRLALVTGVEKI